MITQIVENHGVRLFDNNDTLIINESDPMISDDTSIINESDPMICGLTGVLA
jgi:hypothetical protein